MPKQHALILATLPEQILQQHELSSWEYKCHQGVFMPRGDVLDQQRLSGQTVRVS